jgi:hypothetical protein
MDRREHCGVNRRGFLRIGGATFLGLTMPQLLAARARAATSGRKARAKQVVLVWLEGGPSQIDMFDLKPNSKKAVVRPLFKPIRTSVPELQVSELMPNLARLANRYTILRSMWVGPEGPFGHQAGSRLLTGNLRDRRRNTLAYPTLGSVVAKVKGGPSDVPAYVAVNSILEHDEVGNSFLGSAYNPLVLDINQNGRSPMVDMVAAPHLDIPVLDRQVRLLERFDRKMQELDQLEPDVAAIGKHQRKALDMLRSPRIRDALDLSRESPKRVQRYGNCTEFKKDLRHTKLNHDQNQTLLIARRLVEAGVPFIRVTYMDWDWHGPESNVNGQPTLMPRWDIGMSAFLEDLEERGLLEQTIVIAMGEQGRGPLNRGHWSNTQFVLLAGGGFARGRIVGATDADGMRPVDDECFPEDLAATIYHQLGIDAHDQLLVDGSRPVRIVDKDNIRILHKTLA